jgi:hypothetical protein
MVRAASALAVGLMLRSDGGRGDQSCEGVAGTIYVCQAGVSRTIPYHP